MHRPQVLFIAILLIFIGSAYTRFDRDLISMTRRFLRRELQQSAFDSDVKNFLDEMNKVRTNPKSIIPELEATVKKFQGKQLGYMMTNEGPGAYNELISFLKKQAPLAPMTWSNGLGSACQKFVNVAGPSGATGHSSPNGDSMSDRISAEGSWQSTIGENLAYGDRDGKKSLIQLMVDDGVPSRGHRKNIFNTKFKVIGIAIGSHKGYRFMTCNDFAGGMGGAQEANPKFKVSGASGSSAPAKPATNSTPTVPKIPSKPTKPSGNGKGKSGNGKGKSGNGKGKSGSWSKPGKNGGVKKGGWKKNDDGSSSSWSSWSSDDSGSGNGDMGGDWGNWKW